MGGLAFDELFRVRSAVNNVPLPTSDVVLIVLAIPRVDNSGEIGGRVPNDRTWAAIGEQEGPARVTGKVQAQARATPSPCRAAILAG